MRLVRAGAIAVTAGGWLLAGCGSTHSAASTGTSTTTATTGVPATGITTVPVSTTSTTSPQTGGAAPGTNLDGPTPGPGQPGGDPASRAYLANKGWINDAGQVVAQGFNLNGNGQTDDQSFCSYVFGTGAEVAKATKVSAAALTFDDPNSGTQGDGTILCAYTLPGQSTDIVGMGVGNTSSLKSTAAGGKGVVTVPATPGNEILFAYDPQYTGATIAAPAAKAWLDAALARVDFTGLTNT